MLRAGPPGHPLQKPTVVQWDIGAMLSADGAADESVSPQSGITLAYGYSLRGESSNMAAQSETVRLGIGCLLIITSLLFWRLDKRSQNLIKASEDALKRAEIRLAALLGGDESIRLMQIDGHKSQKGVLSYIETFRQIYALIFLLVGLSGAWIVARHFGVL
jgi:hypothetical protein